MESTANHTKPVTNRSNLAGSPYHIVSTMDAPLSSNDDQQIADVLEAKPPPQMEFTSTTAPGKVFASRNDLAAHYKTPWHKYNLKRREAGLPPLLETDFLARLAAAQAVHLERVTKKSNSSTCDDSGKGHLKSGKQQKKNKDRALHESNKEGRTQELTDFNSSQAESDGRMPVSTNTSAHFEINPKQCLFDRHVSASVQANVDRMHRKYGFFIPDYEYLFDMTGLVGYCHEKIQLGHVCLYCHRTFRTPRSCIQHMHNKNHTKLRYEISVDLEDLDVFYDFTDADQAFLKSTIHPRLQGPSEVSDDDMVNEDDDEENVDDLDWEDVSDDEEGGDEDDDEMDGDEELYHGYEEEVARMGWKVTPLGELIFPDGRIMGHRGLRRYYKQRLSQHKETSVAVSAARQAAGERLYRGRVYNIGYNGNAASNDSEFSEKNVALAIMGISPGMAAGRAGKGILVTSPSGTYSQVSVYRYRAAICKQRRQMRQGRQLVQRTTANLNRMDKKANRLMNNVSVAHAQR
jgi:pre-60S factor REI1